MVIIYESLIDLVPTGFLIGMVVGMLLGAGVATIIFDSWRQRIIDELVDKWESMIICLDKEEE